MTMLFIIRHIEEDFKFGSNLSHFFKYNTLFGDSILMPLAPSDSENAEVLALGSLHGAHTKSNAVVVVEDLSIASINGSNFFHGREPSELVF